MKALLVVLAAIWLVAIYFAGAIDATTWHPIGLDEYGRDSLRALIAATGWSVLHATLMLGCALILPAAVAWLAAFRQMSAASWLLKISAQVIESIPAVLLVLAAVAAFPKGGLLLISVIFAVVVFPAVGKVLAGEFSRLGATGYVQVAHMQQISELSLLRRYVLPNAVAVLKPLLLQLFGSAMTVIGAVGVLGMSNRQTLDLGVFLLRGKEQLMTRPSLMLVTLLAFVIVFLIASRILRLTDSRAALQVWQIKDIGEATRRLLAGQIGIVSSKIGLIVITASPSGCEVIALEKGWVKQPFEHRKSLGRISPEAVEKQRSSLQADLLALKLPICIGFAAENLDARWRDWLFPADRVWQLHHLGAALDKLSQEIDLAGAILAGTTANFSARPNLLSAPPERRYPAVLQELDPGFAQLADFYLDLETSDVLEEDLSVVDLSQNPAVLFVSGFGGAKISEVLRAHA